MQANSSRFGHDSEQKQDGNGNGAVVEDGQEGGEDDDIELYEVNLLADEEDSDMNAEDGAAR